MTDYKSWKTGLSIHFENGYSQKDFAAFKASGIDAVELSPRFGKEDELDWGAIRAESEKTGVAINSYHLPFKGSYTISDPDEEKRKAVVKNNIRLIKLAASVGAKYMVVHPSTEPIAEEDRPVQMAQAQKSLKELADAAEDAGAVICVEDLPRTCLGRDVLDMKALLSADDRLRVCFDVNHLLRGSHEEFVRELGDKIVTLHISDYDYEDECHFVPGIGSIDWKALTELLENADYSGVFLYESSLGEFEKHGIHSPAHTYEDIHKNHMNIKTFTGEGKRI